MTTPIETVPRAVGLSASGLTKTFGRFRAIDDVALDVPAGSFHVLLGENGAGKSTLVKCLMGFHLPDRGEIRVDGQPVAVRSPREAQRLGIGMVYQHFTLAQSLTAAENLVVSRADSPGVIDWAREGERLTAFLDRMPFKVRLDVPVGALSAGERQKLEILKLLYLSQRFLILDEPTSVLTPGEADEVLGMLKAMTRRGEISVLMISHKFREVLAYSDAVTVLRRGRLAGAGATAGLDVAAMAAMMIGDAVVASAADRVPYPSAAGSGGESGTGGGTRPDAGSGVSSVVESGTMPQPPRLAIAGLLAEDDDGSPLLSGLDLKVHPGEILGIAGVSGNGQAALVEVLTGQRRARDGRIEVDGRRFEPTRADYERAGFHCLPEEPMRNAAAARMTVAENLAFRAFDRAPLARGPGWLSPSAIRRRALPLIERYRIKTPSADAPLSALSGGNVQRAMLARELAGEVRVLVVANPCFGLDFASVADIRAQIIAQRNRGAAVLLLSEDLDEILELADRVAVMSAGTIAYTAAIGDTDRQTIGRHMAGAH